MAAEFRFECSFCLKPISISYEMAGKKIRCPHCKNPITVPVQGIGAPEKEKSAGKDDTPVRRKNPHERPIQARYKWGFKSFCKLVLFVAAVYGAYYGYEYYQQQSKKDLPTLIREYGEGQKANKFLVYQRLTAEDFDTVHQFAGSSNAEVRELSAECLGKLQLPKSIDPLLQLLNDRESTVRKIAAESLGTVRCREARKSVEYLIKHLDVEKDDYVKTSVIRSLSELTGQNAPTGKKDFWRLWWKEEGRRFQIRDY